MSYLRGFAGIGKCALVLFEIFIRGVQTGDHATETVPSEALPQEAGKLGVSVGNVGACTTGHIVQGGDALPQGEK